jgi:D-glycero-D-manno-heptose 1,7-bisphosphate phosphatase
MTEAASVALRQCVILVGGMGTRLGALTATTPKPVLPVGDRPFLAWLLRELSRYGFEEALLLTGHLSGALRASVESLAATLPRPMKIVFSEEPIRAGTGGALFHARNLLDPRFLLCNGDSLLDCNLAPLLANARADSAEVIGRILLRHLPDVSRYGVVTTEGDVVTGFHERPTQPGAAQPGDINGGVYVFRRDVMPVLATQGLLRAQRGHGFFIDIGIPEDLDRAQTALPRLLHRRALFLDRDGVINEDHGYVGTRERFTFTRTAQAAIAAATNAGWHVFIVTNQSGVARGFYDEAAVHALHVWLRDQALLAGGTIDDIRYCPFHPEGTVAAYARAHEWRKPQPGMLLDLIRAWELDPARCLLVGDQPSDLAAASAAGVPSVLFDGGDLAALVAPRLAATG